MKIITKVRPSTETLDLEGLSLTDLYEILDDLEQKRDIVQADEPEDDDSKEYEEWEEAIEDLEDQIEAVQEAIDDLEDEWDD